LQLTARERQTLREARAAVKCLRWRIRMLELLDRSWKQSQIATAVSTYPREVRRGLVGGIWSWVWTRR
jgi:hypothetical protein